MWRELKCKECGDKFEHYTTTNSYDKEFCERCLRQRNSERVKARYRAKKERVNAV